jgi:hypothetical protein
MDSCVGMHLDPLISSIAVATEPEASIIEHRMVHTWAMLNFIDPCDQGE